MKRLKAFFATIFTAGLCFPLLGGAVAVDTASATTLTPTEVRPVAEYTFDKTGDAWLENSGSWGEAYNLQKSSLAKRENWGANSGGVNFSDDSCLYLTGDKYIFNELDEFTIAIDFYAERNANWYSSLFSWDILEETSITNMSRFSIGYKTGQDWLRYSDVDILGSISKEGTAYGSFFSKGESLLSQNVDNANSGWWKFIYSVKPGGVAITYLTTGTSNVNYVTVNKVPADYSLKNENAAFSIGAAFKNSSLGLEWKANAIMDSLRIYDFAMTEMQMTELRWTSMVCKAPVVISSEIENGNVTANKTEALSGELVLLDVQPNAGYEIDKVYVNDMEILPLDGVYYTNMTKAGASVYATFKEIPTTPVIPESSNNSSQTPGNSANSSVNSSTSEGQDPTSPLTGCFGTISGVAFPVAFAMLGAAWIKRKQGRK